ncbi:MAG TPA: hypothetical protein VF237_04425 [Xanthobacteraceae bacterium]
MKTLKFLAIVLTALALVPGGAHFFSLPNKITLTESNYFIVQNIYRGWALFGIVLFGALFANMALAWAMRWPGLRLAFWSKNVDARHKAGHDDHVDARLRSERNLVVHVIALAAGAGHGRLALA